jgi:hypothetical protein
MKTITKTIAQILNIKEFPFEIKDKMGNVIYEEFKDMEWIRKEFDSKGNETRYEHSNYSPDISYWHDTIYDANNNPIYHKNSNGFWIKRIYDKNNKQIDFESGFDTPSGETIILKK